MATKKSSGHPSASQQPEAGLATTASSASDPVGGLDGVDDFVKSLTNSIAELMALKDNEAREGIARNVTRSLMQGQAEKIRIAVEEDRAKAGRNNPESLEQALTVTMEALTKVQALLEAIEIMINGDSGDSITLVQIGLQVAGEAHEAAQRALPAEVCHA